MPLAIFGGLVFILFLNSSVNIFSQIALIILIGISTKNSILIVDYANQIRTTGKNIDLQLLKKLCSVRFRPIIMTSLSTMIAMFPLVIGNIGPGAGEGIKAGCWFDYFRWYDYFNIFYTLCYSINVFSFSKKY